MRLPAGSTGFDAPPVDAAAHRRAFLTACHHAARAIGGRVAGIEGPGVTPNFHLAEIAHRDGRLSVLGHGCVLFAAIAGPRPWRDLRPTFADDPAVAAAIVAASALRPLAVAELSTPLDQADLSALGPGEHRQIAYWKPDTVGELLFNYWD